MNKKAQLMGIEFKFFIIGLLIGIVLGGVILYLSKTGTIPFRIPFVCK